MPAPGYLQVRDRLIPLCAQRPRLKYKEIAAALGIPHGSCARYIQLAIEDGLVAPLNGTGKPRPPTAEQQARIADITRRRAEGQIWEVIGAHLGVSKQAARMFWYYHAAGAG